MRQFFTKKELKLKKKRLLMMVACMAVLLAGYVILTWPKKVESVEGVTTGTINLVFEPEWDKDMMSEEAKLELGFL